MADCNRHLKEQKLLEFLSFPIEFEYVPASLTPCLSPISAFAISPTFTNVCTYILFIEMSCIVFPLHATGFLTLHLNFPPFSMPDFLLF